MKIFVSVASSDKDFRFRDRAFFEKTLRNLMKKNNPYGDDRVQFTKRLSSSAKLNSFIGNWDLDLLKYLVNNLSGIKSFYLDGVKYNKDLRKHKLFKSLVSGDATLDQLIETLFDVAQLQQKSSIRSKIVQLQKQKESAKKTLKIALEDKRTDPLIAKFSPEGFKKRIAQLDAEIQMLKAKLK